MKINNSHKNDKGVRVHDDCLTPIIYHKAQDKYFCSSCDIFLEDDCSCEAEHHCPFEKSNGRKPSECPGV